MAFIYEINGQRVEFEREPTEKDIDDAARSLRPAPQSQQQRPVEGSGGAAFGVYRPQGRRPESQQDREAAKDMPFQTARGLVTGGFGAPADILNLPGTIYSAVSGQPAPYQVPYGSEQLNEMLPGRSDAPSAKLARFGGELLAPVPGIKALQTIPGAVRGVGDVVSGAVGTGTGYIARPGRTPRGYQVPSQRNPIGATFTPPEELAKFERGELPYGQMPEQRPISELPQGKLDQAAMMLSGGNIPNAGQGARAFGERLGETYRNPLTAAADIGSMFFTGGVPVLTTLRGGLAGAQALADMRLASKGFTPELPKKLEEYQTGVRPMPGIQPGPMPRGFQAAGPISPGGLAAATPAATAAMATTQRVAGTTPRAPAQPRPVAQPFVLPDVGTHYNQAAQTTTNFGDTFNQAVAARKTDLLKDAKQRGTTLTPQQAEDLAFDEIKAWRGQNVEAFKPKQQAVGPVEPTATPEEVIAQFNPPKVDEELLSDQRIWKMLQDKTAAGTKLGVNEETAVRRITNKYGQDPFQTGNLTGETVLETPKRKNVKQETRVKEMEAERTKDMTPEQIAADEQAMMDRVKRMSDPNSKFNKTLRGDLGSVKTTPKVEPTPPKSELKQGDTFTVNDDDFMGPGNYQGIDKELVNKIPKKIEWIKESNFENAKGEIVVSEYISKATKNQPEYKLVDNFMNDEPSKLYVKKGNDWELVADEKTIIDAKEAASEAAFKQKMDAYLEPTLKETGLTFDEFMALPEDKLIELGKQMKKSKGKPPAGTMEMMTGGKQFDSKADYEAQVLLDRLAGKPTTGSFVDNGLRYEITEIDYGNTPKDLLKRLNKPLTEIRVFSERTNNQISGPAPDVPEKPLRQRIEERRKGK